MFSRINRIPLAKFARKFSAPTAKPGAFREKTPYEIWCGDSGAYPVMGVIVFACVFCTGWGLKNLLFSPDARVSKKSRMSLFRGDLAGEH